MVVNTELLAKSILTFVMLWHNDRNPGISGRAARQAQLLPLIGEHARVTLGYLAVTLVMFTANWVEHRLRGVVRQFWGRAAVGVLNRKVQGASYLGPLGRSFEETTGPAEPHPAMSRPLCFEH